MDRPTPVYEDLEAALKAAVQHLGGTKRVGTVLWPDKTVSDADIYLSNCLDGKRREKLATSQIMWILREAKRVGFHDAMNFIADDAEYERPKPMDSEAQREKLMRDFMELMKEHNTMMDKFMELGYPLPGFSNDSQT